MAYVRSRDRYEQEREDDRVNTMIRNLGRALGAEVSG